MQISQVLGGYTPRPRRPAPPRDGQEEGRGDGEGARRLPRGLREERASTRRSPASIFDLMEKFAEYGFNKSHSAAYGLITVQTAWLKAHYPVEFMAALISSEADNTDKVVLHIAEARAGGHRGAAAGRERVRTLRRVPPARKAVAKGKIRFGLGAIKGVGEGAIEAILEARKDGRAVQGPLRLLRARRLAGKINRKVVEALVKAGAFDFESVPALAALRRRSTARSPRARRRRPTAPPGQASLFGAAGAGGRGEAALPRRLGDMVGDAARRGVAGAGAARVREGGARVSTSPATRCRATRRRCAATRPPPAPRSRRSGTATRSRWSAIVAALRERMNKEKGTRFGFLTLEDLTGTVEVICWGGAPGPERPARAEGLGRLGGFVKRRSRSSSTARSG